MFHGIAVGWMHVLVSWLLQPVVVGLMALTALSVMEVGTLLAEYFRGLPAWRNDGNRVAFERIAKRRIERSDFLARIAPMLGLMGTLIPLGPGLAALGQGKIGVLTTAMSIAFDTTVLGLLVGITGFVIGRLRRRWYDELLSSLECKESQ